MTGAVCLSAPSHLWQEEENEEKEVDPQGASDLKKKLDKEIR